MDVPGRYRVRPSRKREGDNLIAIKIAFDLCSCSCSCSYLLTQERAAQARGLGYKTMGACLLMRLFFKSRSDPQVRLFSVERFCVLFEKVHRSARDWHRNTAWMPGKHDS